MLEWIANPGIKALAVIGRNQYHISYPSLGIDGRTNELFYEPRAFMASVIKNRSNGWQVMYIIGHGYASEDDARKACQTDYDQHGDKADPAKVAPDQMEPEPRL